MKRIVMAAIVAASLIPAAVALACGKDCGCNHDKMAMADPKADAAKPNFKTATVDEVAKAAKAKSAALFDANTEEFRAKNGVIPGATLLTSASGYDLVVLPKDKGSKLVFYCANTRCTASHVAAGRAMEAGYTDVSVMTDGLMGWKSAGQPTSTVPKS
ncbi:MAG: rhodanese-like domain-containing protein [Deltaproteobacteria bacterium]|nr:rhodanese-like domain-containing protein [Deltaproteobacteria bacterium]